ncbi:MAG TPA: hypothetical protein VI875_01955, partial [Candidatus Norongarragalinales archaeon]|nr:hypothetical protein [Candidatus Norongarragalinales archaeon]
EKPARGSRALSRNKTKGQVRRTLALKFADPALLLSLQAFSSFLNPFPAHVACESLVFLRKQVIFLPLARTCSH